MPMNLQTRVDDSNKYNMTVLLSWEAPHLLMQKHGTLLYYLINCTFWRDDYDHNNNITVQTNDTNQTLEVLPYASYTCCVSTVNEVGVGTPACQSFITYESGTYK